MRASYGSTRWGRERIRQDTAGPLRLDVRSLKQAEALQPGTVSTSSWTRADGEPAGNIVVRMDRDGDRLTLDYSTRDAGETDWTPRAIHVWLDTTRCHYGGERVWFRCPHYRSRRAVLYSSGGGFSCRACHDLAYTSTREDAIDRATRRVRTLQRTLKAPADCDPWHMPEKPAGMHWTTYQRLVSQLYAATCRIEWPLAGTRQTVERHVVFYYLTDAEIVIVRILHRNQDAAGKGVSYASRPLQREVP